MARSRRASRRTKRSLSRISLEVSISSFKADTDISIEHGTPRVGLNSARLCADEIHDRKQRKPRRASETKNPATLNSPRSIVEPLTIGLSTAPPSSPPTLPTATFRKDPCGPSVLVTLLATQPTSPPDDKPNEDAHGDISLE